MGNFQEDYQLLIDRFKKNGLTKSFVITVLAKFALDFDFIKVLDGFFNEDVIRRDTIGVVYSDEFDKNDTGYFGEDRILFYYGVDENWYDIITFGELCNYLQVVCDFYVEKHDDKAEEVQEYLQKIKGKYKVK
ncbi:ribonuclease toxin immunity protein CdiI [Bacillus sp. NPDC077411]|uniref:ribonuclease toxin immunity protein CdiI n=1 Tax=Bacillus sp. NPDC077411 TaxID=3363947 RepID=UPI0037CB7D30